MTHRRHQEAELPRLFTCVAAEIGVEQLRISAEILAHRRYHFLSLLKHIEVNVNHGHRSLITSMQLLEQTVVGLGQSVFQHIAIAADHRHSLCSRRIHHIEDIEE